MEEKEREFQQGTPVRCNRCDARGRAPRAFRAVRENAKVWRIQDIWVNDCGHMDAHWVFDADLVEEVAR